MNRPLIPEGYRRLGPDETLQKGDQYPACDTWNDTEQVGDKASSGAGFYIRKIEPLKELMTLPGDSALRKEYPIFRGCVRYFPAALAGVARLSKIGNDKHNPGEEMHHARGKSHDHADCILRHLIDIEDMVARGAKPEDILLEADSVAWRALALSQLLHEKHGSPKAPGAK